MPAVRRRSLFEVLGSAGTSALVHAVILIALSFCVIAHDERAEEIVAEVHFEHLDGDVDSMVIAPEPQLVGRDVPEPVSTRRLLGPEQTSQSSDLRVNLTAFTGRPASEGLPEGIAEIARGIRGRVERAGGQHGEVQFSLAWHSLNDLDLHIITPSGEHISYRHRESRCRGELDVDMNAKANAEEDEKTMSREPVENIRWLGKSAPMGRYTVLVHLYQSRNGGLPDPFQLLSRLGEHPGLIEDEVHGQRRIRVFRFQYIRTSLPAGRQKALADEFAATQEREERQATEMLERGLDMPPGANRDRQMMKIIEQYPHTDASLRAMQELKGEEKLLR